MILSELGHRDIRVADRNADRVRLVAQVTGARAVSLDPQAASPVRYGIEATGSTAALRALLGCIGTGGAIALVGIMHGNLDLDPNLLVEREVSLIGCHAFKDELPEAISLLARCAGRARALVEAEIGLDDVPEAYRRLIAGETVGLKTIIRP